jgi:pimeloyl-ACP methyl ester carboxylesterase
VTRRRAELELAPGGARLCFELAGTGEAVLLVHGNGLDMRMWDDQVEALAREHLVLRYDMRGFGRSSPPDQTPYSPVADARALLDHLGIASAHVVGFSLGGARALDFALAHPEMTGSLVLADAALGGHRWAGFATFMAEVRAAGREGGAEAARCVWSQGALFAPAREQPQAAARLAEMTADYCAWPWIGNREHVITSEPPAIERLAEIECPTLVLVGERDLPDFQVIADTLHRGIPGASKAVIPGVGHMTPMEAPGPFNALVLGFLAGDRAG